MIERIAHRGSPVAARENTLPAFAAALEAGCDWIELDVRTSADGRCVVLHDATLLRLWGLPRDVAQTPWPEIAALGTGEQRIPQLADVLELCADSGTGILIDLDDARDVAAAVATVTGHRAAREGRVAVQWCGDTAALQQVRARLPHAVLRYAAFDGLDDAALAALAPAYMNTSWTQLSPQRVRQWHAAGYRVACWTVDEVDDIRCCRDLGVDAITTDQLRRLHAVLDAPAPTAPPDPVVAGVDIDRALAVATRLAHDVIAYTRAHPVTETTAKTSAADVVTNVDLGVETLVRERLAAEFGDHVVVGEEYGGAPRPGVPTWYVDPVDGTANLGNGVPWTSLSLALAVDDEPLVGVVAQPWTGEVAAAAVERGVTLDGLPVAARASTALPGGMFFTELAAQHPWRGFEPLLCALADADVTCRVMGSGTLSCAMPGLGRGLGGCVEKFNPIDHLAAVVIAQEAGCRLFGLDGPAAAFPPHDEPLLIAAPGVAAELFAAWERALRS